MRPRGTKQKVLSARRPEASNMAGNFPGLNGKISENQRKNMGKTGFVRWENHRKRWEHPLSMYINSNGAFVRWKYHRTQMVDLPANHVWLSDRHKPQTQLVSAGDVTIESGTSGVSCVCVYIYMCVQIDKNSTRLYASATKSEFSVCETKLQQVQSHKTHRSYWWLSEPSTTKYN